MHFPVEIWSIIKVYLLQKFGIVWKRIGDFQKEHNLPGLDLQCHIYYRILRTARESLLESILEFMANAQDTLNLLEFNIRFNNNYSSYPDEDLDFKDSTYECMKCIKVYKMGDTFLNIYKTAPINTLLEILDKINQYDRGKGLTYFIKKIYLFLHETRKKRQEGTIRYIWKIDTISEFEKIKSIMDSSPEIRNVTLRENFVIAFEKRPHSWLSFNTRTKSFDTFMDSMRIAEISWDTSTCHGSKFKRFLEEAGFPLKNIYEKELHLK